MYLSLCVYVCENFTRKTRFNYNLRLLFYLPFLWQTSSTRHHLSPGNFPPPPKNKGKTFIV